MKAPFWELKNDSRNLIRGHWNVLVLTLFIPFILYFAVMSKFVLNLEESEIVPFINNYKFMLILFVVMYLFSVANIAVFAGINKIKNGEKPNFFDMYRTGFSNTLRYLPTLLLTSLLPNLLSFVLSREMIMKFYDYLLFAFIDVQTIEFVIALINYIIIAINMYIGMSILFVPIILVVNERIKGFDALKESFKMSKGIRWYLFFLGLSFFGWFMLGALAFFIGILWVAAYHSGAIYSYYSKVALTKTSDFDENQITIND
jgi:uncharacterized membrane protein